MLGRFLNDEERSFLSVEPNLAIWYGPFVSQSVEVKQVIERLAGWMKAEFD